MTNRGARAVLGTSVLVLLSCAVINVLLAVTESVWWPLPAGALWWGVAVGVVIRAAAAAPARSRTPDTTSARVFGGVPARRG